MIIHNVLQGSEEWENLRKGKATASRFGEILTPKKLDLSSSCIRYAAQLAAERLGIESPEPPPTFWMEYGTEAEDYAVAEFEKNVSPVRRVGFCEVAGVYGCSPDAIMENGELLEVKCPKAETLIQYHYNKKLPDAYKLQVQGQLWVTDSPRCHFYAWHPQIEPFHIVVERDHEVADALNVAIPKFNELVNDLVRSVTKRDMPRGFQFIDMSEDLE